MDKASFFDVPLGLASGVTPKNVIDALPYTQVFIVATGIERHFGVLNAAKTAELVRLVHEAPVDRESLA